MSQHQKSRILCIDANGRLAGVISLADIAAADKSAKPADVLRSLKAPAAHVH
jgi:hypothetical protein